MGTSQSCRRRTGPSLGEPCKQGPGTPVWALCSHPLTSKSWVGVGCARGWHHTQFSGPADGDSWAVLVTQGDWELEARVQSWPQVGCWIRLQHTQPRCHENISTQVLRRWMMDTLYATLAERSCHPSGEPGTPHPIPTLISRPCWSHRPWRLVSLGEHQSTS